jgi:hypothetical protein
MSIVFARGTGGGGIEGRSDTDLRIWATGDIGGERNESVFKSKEGFGIPRKDSLRIGTTGNFCAELFELIFPRE